jgi:hypothetical protein
LAGVDLDRVRLAEVPPLPDTAVELRAVAKTLGAPLSDILAGMRAKQPSIMRRLPITASSISPPMGLWRVTSKGSASGRCFCRCQRSQAISDDGLLTASEVAQLKLNADWVVLSACNTAAGDKPAQALSGLARAFFYAGARALLVSHWKVDSQAAVRLATGTFGNLRSDPKIGRAEALRRPI